MIKRIYAIVSDKTFYKFKQRAYSLGFNFGEALTALANGFADGKINLSNNPKKIKKEIDNKYLIDHAEIEKKESIV